MDNFPWMYFQYDDSHCEKSLNFRSVAELVKGQDLQGKEQLMCTDVVLKPNYRDGVGDDARRLEKLKELVQNGADVNVQSGDVKFAWKTSAMIAAQQGFLLCLKFLVESGADLSMTTPRPHGKCRFKMYNDTALTLAVQFGQSSCVEYLTQHMSLDLINAQNSFGFTALMLAARGGDPEFPVGTEVRCLEILLAAGAEVNMERKDGRTALMFALEKRRPRAVDLLLQHGARLDAVTRFGHTALTEAVARGGDLSKLTRHGLDPTLSCFDNNCLHHAVAKRKNVSTVHALVESGLPPLDVYCRSFARQWGIYTPTYTPWKRVSPLAVAVIAHRPCIAKYLINKRFFTPYDVFQLCHNRAIRQALVNASVNTWGMAQECLNLFDYLSSTPQPLQTLSLIAVSTACSQVRCAVPRKKGKSNWVRRPTFRERVQCLPLPEVMKRQLLHQTPSPSGEVCCGAWRTMPQFSERYCEYRKCH